MTQEGIQIDGESEGSSLNPEIQQEAVEKSARAKGWKPLEQYKGDPADWVDAKEFIGREKLYSHIKGLKQDMARQAAKAEQDMAVISKHFAEMREVEYQRALETLNAELEAAVEDQDKTRVRQINSEIKDVEKKQQQAKQEQKAPQSAQPTPEFLEWKQQNEWFDNDRELQQEAIAIGIGYAAANPNKTQADMLKHVSSRMKKIYPEKFELEQEEQQEEESTTIRKGTKVESAGGKGTQAVEGKKGKGLKVSDLSEQERSVMRVLIKRGALKHIADKEKISQEEVYLRQLQEAKDRG